MTTKTDNIKRFVQTHLKRGETVMQVAKRAEERYGQTFKIVDGNIYRETQDSLKIVVSHEYIEGLNCAKH